MKLYRLVVGDRLIMVVAADQPREDAGDSALSHIGTVNTVGV